MPGDVDAMCNSSDCIHAGHESTPKTESESGFTANHRSEFPGPSFYIQVDPIPRREIVSPHEHLLLTHELTPALGFERLGESSSGLSDLAINLTGTDRQKRTVKGPPNLLPRFLGSPRGPSLAEVWMKWKRPMRSWAELPTSADFVSDAWPKCCGLHAHCSWHRPTTEEVVVRSFIVISAAPEPWHFRS